jgi:hypothetical protein
VVLPLPPSPPLAYSLSSSLLNVPPVVLPATWLSSVADAPGMPTPWNPPALKLPPLPPKPPRSKALAVAEEP